MKLKMYKLAFPLILGGLLLFSSCKDQPTDENFFVWENKMLSDGRYLAFKALENTPTYQESIPEKRFALCPTNMFCHQAKNLKASSDSLWQSDSQEELYPIYVHRPTGRIDTLYTTKSEEGNDMCLGYISGFQKSGEFLVLECKKPGKILGHSYLANKEQDKNLAIMNLTMSNYLSEGQEKVFESSIVSYWIANIHTTDLYGPFTIKSVQPQMLKLGLTLPLQLDGAYDMYTSNNNREKTNLFKGFHRSNHRQREGTTIGK